MNFFWSLIPTKENNKTPQKNLENLEENSGRNSGRKLQQFCELLFCNFSDLKIFERIASPKVPYTEEVPPPGPEGSKYTQKEGGFLFPSSTLISLAFPQSSPPPVGALNRCHLSNWRFNPETVHFLSSKRPFLPTMFVSKCYKTKLFGQD